MSKSGPRYRGKMGHGHKPFPYCRDHRSWEDARFFGGSPWNSQNDSRRRPGNYHWKQMHTGNIPVDENGDNKEMTGSDLKNRRPVPFQKFRERKEDSFENDTSQKSRGKLKCPPELKGKEIGLWYKKQQSKRLEQQHTEIFVSPETQEYMEEFLNRTSFSLTKDEDDLSPLTKGMEFEGFEERIALRSVQPKKNNVKLDKIYYEELINKRKDPKYEEMCKFREKLPAFKMREEIVKVINENQITVISGGTGCGKTTQIVQFVLDDCIMNMNGSVCNILCTQPRRISALSVAERVASERLEPLSLSVGYQIRFDNKLSERKVGCINFVTTGVLLQWLVGEPLLANISHIFLDEVHERTVQCDTVMALLKYIIPKRPDIKVILMSATVNAQSFSDYYDGAPGLEIPGFTFPVEEIFLEDILKLTPYKFESSNKTGYGVFRDFVMPYVRDLEADGSYPKSVTRELANPASEELDISFVAHVVRYICDNEGEGAILVFLPGLSDISNLSKEITASPWYSPRKYVLVVVHSMLPAADQKDAFKTPPKGKRKIVIATSILETSVTIDDISYVVDCGKIKLSGYDLKLRVATLSPSWISLANAKQRRGRAGRTKAGKCYKLYTRARQSALDLYPTPEIQTSSLEDVILEAKSLRIQRVIPFLEKMMDPPNSEMVELALKALINLNALDSEERLTPLGYHLSRLPMDVRTGKMILMGALFSCIDPIFSIAACLSFKDPFSVPLGQEENVIKVKKFFAKGEKSDHLICSEIIKYWEDESPKYRSRFTFENFLSNSNLHQLRDMKKQFAEILCSMNFLSSTNLRDPASNVNSDNKELIKAIVCAGLYPNVAILKNVKREAVLRTVENRAVRFHIKSYLYRVGDFDSSFFVYHYKLKSSSIFLHDASMVDVLPILLFAKNLKVAEKGNHFFIEVDDTLKFKIGLRSATLIKKIKTRLDWILGSAILNSEGFNWNQRGEEIEILSGIVDLLSKSTLKHIPV